MTKPRVFATVVLAAAVVACDRTEVNREAEQAADQVRDAAGEAGERLADSWLTAKIQAQFFADDDVKARYINVTTRDGVVSLKGFVEDEDVRRQALEIAHNTDGVRQVRAEQLLIGRPVEEESFDSAEVTPLPDAVATTGVDSTAAAPTFDDQTVTSLIQAKYFRDPAIKSRHIDVQTVSGVVTLSGEVASESERSQALQLARQTQGVQRVEDALTVNAFQ